MYTGTSGMNKVHHVSHTGTGTTLKRARYARRALMRTREEHTRVDRGMMRAMSCMNARVRVHGR